MSTNETTPETIQQDYKNSKRLTMYANSYSRDDQNNQMVIFHLEDEEKNKYIAIHHVKCIEYMFYDYSKAKAKLDFNSAMKEKDAE